MNAKYVGGLVALAMFCIISMFMLLLKGSYDQMDAICAVAMSFGPALLLSSRIVTKRWF